ncbi:mannose-6-phosphate isomerase, class I [Nesterenkonia suensis]
MRDYAWGSTTAFSRLFGLPADGPQAELWMGAHPAAPSQVLLDESPTDLDALCAQHPELRVRQGGFPYLFKVLAADQPLSIQTHPTRERARAGYAAEEAAGVPLDSPQRSYKDTHHKPELLVAVEDFSALCGFRPGAEAAADVAALRDLLAARPGLSSRGEGTRTETASAEVTEALDRLHHLVRGGWLAEALELILRGDRAAFARAADAVVDLVEGIGLSPSAADTLARAATAFPGDPGVIVTLLLNRVDLSPGQALYLPAGNLHAYLHGVAVEIMANSDNVLRGGLTSKHIDVDELLAVTDATVLPVPLFEPEPVGPGHVRYAPDCDEFQLERLHLGAAEGPAEVHVRAEGPGILLCLRGTIRVDRADAEAATGQDHECPGQGVLELRAGESAFLSTQETVRLRLSDPEQESAEAFLATPGNPVNAPGR